VHMHEVEALAHRHLVLLDGQRERVRGRLLEERVLHLRDLVKRHALGEPAEPERARVGDEVDLVAAPRQLEAQLGGNSARAAVRRIAGDADSHAAAADCQRLRIKSASTEGSSVASKVHTAPSRN